MYVRKMAMFSILKSLIILFYIPTKLFCINLLSLFMQRCWLSNDDDSFYKPLIRPDVLLTPELNPEREG